MKLRRPNADALLIAGNDYIQGTNLYAYCYNNPVMYSDPSGSETTDDLIYTITGVLFGLLYISQHVPLSVLSGYISSMFGHDFETGREKADYILRIAEAYLPQEGWSTQYPYPTKITNVGFQVIMDGRFISKNYCLEYSDAIINCFGNGNTYLGMDRERIAVELYGHAMIHFCLPTIKKTPIYDTYKEQIDSFYTSSDPIDINYNEGSGRILVFYALWNLT